MKRIVMGIFSTAGILSWIFVVTGCGGQVYNRKHYVLQTTGPAKAVSPAADNILEVRRFTIDSSFQSTGLVYRKSEFEYETDFYNHFLAPPAEMITEKTRNWLAAAADFATVLDSGSTIDPTCTLQANILAFYGNFRPNMPPKAVMEIRFFLSAEDNSAQRILLTRTYQASHELKDKSAEGLVEGFDRCLASILTELEGDLRKKL